jgi:hypothetical protein
MTYDDFRDFRTCNAALAEHFSQKQVAKITATVITMNLWACLK